MYKGSKQTALWVNESIGEDAQRRATADPGCRKTSAGCQAIGQREPAADTFSLTHVYRCTLMRAHYVAPLTAFHAASPSSI